MKLNELLGICGRPSYVKEAADQPYRDQYDKESREDVYLACITKLASGQPVGEWGDLARFWGIAQDVKTAQDNWAGFASEEAPAPADDAYVLNVTRDGQTVRRYPAWDADSTVKAASAFYENRAHYPLEWRRDASIALLTKVATYDASIPLYIDNYLNRAAGLAEATQESLCDAVYQRACCREKLGGFEKVAEVIVKIAHDPELLNDADVVATAIQALEDSDADLPPTKRASLPLPEEALVELSQDLLKVAQDELSDHVTLMNGQTVKVGELSREALDAVDPELGAMSTEQLRDVLPTLPLGDADLLVRLHAG